jgi:3-deoxy-D-manno-octulosonic-acid transferase
VIIIFYQLLGIIIYPLLIIYAAIRVIRKKDLSNRISEKFGFASLNRKQGKLVWLHAASVGELISIIPIIENIDKNYPNYNILVTTCSIGSSQIFSKRLTNTRAIHQFLPFDSYIAVKLFLNHWQPNIAIFAESEIWPALINQTSKICPIYLANARMSPRSFAKWKKYSNIIKTILEKFKIIYVQSKFDLEKYNQFSNKNTKLLGNIKYSADKLPISSQEQQKLLKLCKDRIIMVFASTHKGEEEAAINNHIRLKQKYNNLLTIIVPRHINRIGEISHLLNSKKINVAIRSQSQIINEDTDIYVADTIGELGIFYSIANISFIGGSLIEDIGGHNPIEAARFSTAIIMGNNYDNCVELVEDFQSYQAIMIVACEEELYQASDILISDNEKRESAINATNELLKSKSNLIDILVQEIFNHSN